MKNIFMAIFLEWVIQGYLSIRKPFLDDPGTLSQISMIMESGYYFWGLGNPRGQNSVWSLLHPSAYPRA